MNVLHPCANFGNHKRNFTTKKKMAQNKGHDNKKFVYIIYELIIHSRQNLERKDFQNPGCGTFMSLSPINSKYKFFC